MAEVEQINGGTDRSGRLKAQKIVKETKNSRQLDYYSTLSF